MKSHMNISKCIKRFIYKIIQIQLIFRQTGKIYVQNDSQSSRASASGTAFFAKTNHIPQIHILILTQNLPLKSLCSNIVCLSSFSQSDITSLHMTDTFIQLCFLTKIWFKILFGLVFLSALAICLYIRHKVRHKFLTGKDHIKQLHPMSSQQQR